MQSRGLGRGLAALISDSNADSNSGLVRELRLEQVAPNPFQPRLVFDPVTMQDLIDSVKAHGILQPILVRSVGHERYQVVAGERRLRASREAGLTVIPALVRECTDNEMLEIAVVENVQREDIGPLEAAKAYRRLIDEFNMTQETVAQRVGKNRSTVANTLRLLKLPVEVQESLEAGEITEGHGVALLKADDQDAIIFAWRAAVKKQLTVREVEQLIKQVRNRNRIETVAASAVAPKVDEFLSGGTARSLASPADPHENALLERIQEALRTKVSLRRSSGGAGRIEIEFYSSEDLERIAELLGA